MTKCNICGSNRLDDYECGTCHQAKKDADKLAQYIAREDANFARQAERFEAFVKMQTEAILAAVEGKKPAAPAGLKPGTVGDISRLLAAALDTVRSEMYKLKEGGARDAIQLPLGQGPREGARGRGSRGRGRGLQGVEEEPWRVTCSRTEFGILASLVYPWLSGASIHGPFCASASRAGCGGSWSWRRNWMNAMAREFAPHPKDGGSLYAPWWGEIRIRFQRLSRLLSWARGWGK